MTNNPIIDEIDNKLTALQEQLEVMDKTHETTRAPVVKEILFLEKIRRYMNGLITSPQTRQENSEKSAREVRLEEEIIRLRNLLQENKFEY